MLKNMTLKSQKVKIVRKSHVINKDTNVRWGAIMPNSTSRHKSTKTRNKEMQLWEINYFETKDAVLRKPQVWDIKVAQLQELEFRSLNLD